MFKQIKISDPLIGPEEISAVGRVLRSGILARGEEIRKFEESFANYVDTEHAIATSNGTTALHAALLANDIGKGDEVITPSFSFIASANSVLYTGAKPVFADVRYEDFNISPEEIENKITKNTKAVVVVHLYGQPCDMKPIMKICESHNIKLIEDACQAHGAAYNDKKVGSFGTGCFSFYATKNMTTGEGGMITTNDKKIADNARMIINHGSIKAYENNEVGFNFRMTEMQAAIGTVQLSKLEKNNEIRIKNAEMFNHLLRNIEGIELPKTMPCRKHVFHQYTIKAINVIREKIVAELTKNGIGCGIYYPKPIHKQDLYIKLGYRDSLPISEKLSQEVLSLPVHPRLTEEDIERIDSCIKTTI
ncbi:MAG: DegT/DnrJ/EryC1/StrS family aminotransferase [Nanoarchaeota archaeon]